MKEKKNLHRRMERWEFVSLGLLLYDALAVNAAYFLALWLRYDMRYSAIPPEYLAAFLRFAPVYTAVCLAVFFLLRLYNSLWRFASFNELARSLGATAITCVFHWVGMNAFVCRMPVAYYVIGALGQFLMVTAIRFAYRFIRLLSASRRKNARAVHNAMIIGAGAAGQAVLRELKTSEAADAVPRCIIDDDPNKWGRTIDGVPVVGGREVIAETAERYGVDQILIAIPTLSMQERGRLLTLCSETGCQLKTLPALYQLANGEVSLNKLRPVAVEDLLGRPPISVEMGEIFAQIQGKTILVTGGGGSIGSELCRQIAAHDPKRLMIFDIYENNAYAIQQELRRKYPALELTVLIGSVRDSRRIQAVFQEYRPEVVFHAAAHKHVPLMEGSPNEAIKNNVLGTYKTAFAALKYGARRFVLISTDKAVNPTNIMGASKRLCEMVVQAMDRVSCTGEYGLLPELGRGEESHSDMQGGTRFVAVRFGNVLGSNGSVVPLFKRQIETGDGDASRHHPVLYDHSRGGEPGTAGGGLRQGRRDLRAGHGRAGEDRHAGAEPYPPVGPAAGRGYPHRIHRPAAGGEAVRGEADGGGGTGENGQRPHPHRKAGAVPVRDVFRRAHGAEGGGGGQLRRHRGAGGGHSQHLSPPAGKRITDGAAALHSGGRPLLA